MIKLYSARVCPYALRTRLALEEKGLAYEHIEIDLQHKPAEFVAISRYGKVPALFDDGRHIYESVVINEYLDESYPEPPLMPERPIDRAYARIWIDFANTRMMPASAALRFGKTDEEKAAAAEAFARHCATLGSELGAGPWFSASATAWSTLPTARSTRAWSVTGRSPSQTTCARGGSASASGRPTWPRAGSAPPHRAADARLSR